MNDNPILTGELLLQLINLRAYSIVGDRLSAAAAWSNARRELEKQGVDEATIIDFEKRFR